MAVEVGAQINHSDFLLRAVNARIELWRAQNTINAQRNLANRPSPTKSEFCDLLQFILHCQFPHRYWQMVGLNLKLTNSKHQINSFELHSRFIAENFDAESSDIENSSAETLLAWLAEETPRLRGPGIPSAKSDGVTEANSKAEANGKTESNTAAAIYCHKALQHLMMLQRGGDLVLAWQDSALPANICQPQHRLVLRQIASRLSYLSWLQPYIDGADITQLWLEAVKSEQYDIESTANTIANSMATQIVSQTVNQIVSRVEINPAVKSCLAVDDIQQTLIELFALSNQLSD